MKTSLAQRIRTWAQGALADKRTGRFLLAQLTHSATTVIVLAALLLGAARVGALNSVLAPLAAPAADTSFTTINYQGRLADSSGTPIDNPNPGLGMTFALYDVESGGSAVWTETHANVPVSEGLFSVRLGSISALDTSHLTGDRWLGIQVGTDPEMTPREKLTAVPYAMQAGLALTVADGSITTDKIADGAVTNENLALTRYIIDGVQDRLTLTSSEQLLAQETIDVSYAATYLAFVVFEANGHGGRSTLYLRDEGDNLLGAVTHASDLTHTTSRTMFFELPAGQHTLKLSAVTVGGTVGQEVRSATHAIIIPIAQAP